MLIGSRYLNLELYIQLKVLLSSVLCSLGWVCVSWLLSTAQAQTMWHGLLALLLASSQRGLKDRKQRARFNMDWVREDNLVLLQRGERTTNSSAEGIIHAA